MGGEIVGCYVAVVVELGQMPTNILAAHPDRESDWTRGVSSNVIEASRDPQGPVQLEC